MTEGDARLKAATLAARDQLTALLMTRVDQDGAVRGRCESRILESALLKSLLAKQRARPAVQDGLVDYLKQANREDFLEARIAEVALGGPPATNQVLTYLQGFHHFTGARKRLLLSTLLSILDLIPFDRAMAPERIAYGGHAKWTDLSLCAVKVLHQDARGEVPSGIDHSFLVEQLRATATGTVWEGNTLAHLVALHAVHVCDPDNPLISSGITAMTGALNPDGGLPFITGQSLFVTALVGSALAAAGAPQPLLTRMAQYLVGNQQPDGGWAYDESSSQTDVDDTSRCMLLLQRAASSDHLSSLEGAEEYVVNMAGPDGGFPTYLRGHDSETDLTAGAVTVLAPGWARHAAILTRATDFLLAAQHDDGSFEPSWTRSVPSVTAHVLEALGCIPADDPARAESAVRATAKAVEHLLATQNPDGGWGHRPGDASDALSSAHALSALARHGAPGPVLQHAVSYLLAHQNPRGGFVSPPDQVGPRPIPFDFPVLADVHVLTALTTYAEAW